MTARHRRRAAQRAEIERERPLGTVASPAAVRDSRFPIPDKRSGRFRPIRVIAVPTGPRAGLEAREVSSAALSASAAAASSAVGPDGAMKWL